ncbi:hypothetical protein BKA93DRAFT_588199 [Sparassis latifolia]
MQQRLAAPSSLLPRPREAPRNPIPPPCTLLRASSMHANTARQHRAFVATPRSLPWARLAVSCAVVQKRSMPRSIWSVREGSATSLSRQPSRCNSGVQPPPRSRGGPAKAHHPHCTLLRPLSTLFFVRRPTTRNDGTPVVTPASTFRFALPRAIERKRSAAHLFSEAEGHASHVVVAPANAVQQRRAAPSSRSPRPSKAHHTPPHLPAASLSPLQRAQADHGERRRGPPQRTQALRSSRQPPRSNDHTDLPPRGLQAPTLAR